MNLSQFKIFKSRLIQPSSTLIHSLVAPDSFAPNPCILLPNLSSTRSGEMRDRAERLANGTNAEVLLLDSQTSSLSDFVKEMMNLVSHLRSSSSVPPDNPRSRADLRRIGALGIGQECSLVMEMSQRLNQKDRLSCNQSRI